MQIKNKFDWIYFTTIALVSLSFSLIIGFQFINAEPISIWERLEDLKVKNIESDIEYNQVGDEDIHFINGFPYEANRSLITSGVSSFYQRNISLITTSAYWNTPIHDVNSKLIVSDNSELKLITDQLNGLPIISIITEPDDFFSYEKGIYVQGMENDFNSSDLFYPFPWHRPANYYKKTDDKRKVHFSYYDKKGSVKYNSFALAEISGKATRCFPQKSLRFTASKELGNKKFKYDFFGDRKSYQSLVLRNGGNDNTKSLFRDMLMQSLMKESKVLTSGFIPCEVYLNGEYWGIHFLQNRMDDNFISERYGVKEKEITIVESWNLDQGSELERNNLVKAVKNENNGFNALSELIDMTDLVSYLAGELYFANTDWPLNNLKMYKISDSDKNSKWKFALFDLDYGFGYTGVQAFETNMFEHLKQNTDLFSNMINRLLKSKDFKDLLRMELEKLMNEYCSEEKMKNNISELKQELKNAIENHTSRWGKPASGEDWEKEVDKLNDFALKRSAVMKSQIKKYLK